MTNDRPTRTSPASSRKPALFPPPAEFAARRTSRAPPSTSGSWQRAKDDPGRLLGRAGRSRCTGSSRGTRCSTGTSRTRKWFVGGKLNASYNCLDRHLDGPRSNKAAIIWEGEPGDTPRAHLPGAAPRGLQVRQRAQDARRQARATASPSTCRWSPRLAIAMLACARIGATHSVVFGGFSRRGRRRPQQRRQGASWSSPPTAAGGAARSCRSRQNVDEALEKSPTVEKCIVFNRCNTPVEMKAGRDLWWHELMADASADCPAEPLDSEHPLFILYTSRLDRQAQGRPAHHRRLPARRVADAQVGLRPPGGRHLLVHRRRRLGHRAQLHRLRPARQRRDDGDVRGRAEPPAARTASGRSSRSTASTIFYTAPTAIRAFIKWGDQWPKKHDLSSLRLLGTVGEPINPEAWMWYHEVIGGGRCPIVDTWWQTETGAIMISPLPGAIADQARLARRRPLPGIVAEVVDKQGNPVPAEPGRLPGHPAAVAGDAAHDLRRRRALQAAVLEPGARQSTSPATARAATRTATSGSWAASTTCSTSPATA